MKCYAAFAKDENIRMSGSSGGIFPLISKRFLVDGGIIYAAMYDKEFNVICCRIDNETLLNESFTSKYFQSRLNDSFQQIKTDIKNNKKVLFCGTQCQTMGLRRFLEASNLKSDNILLLDFICHGVPSEDVFHGFMERYSPKKLVALNMRNKDFGWDGGNFSWKMTFDDGEETIKNQHTISFMKGFLSNLYLRPSCYNCKAKSGNGADITLGDFWGIKGVVSNIDASKGVSCIIERTEKGKFVISELSGELEVVQVKYEDILAGNPCLETSVRKPFYRNSFFKKWRNGADFDELIKSANAYTLKNRIINKVYSLLPKMQTHANEIKGENERLIYSKKEQCCGCSACYSICPVNAIYMKKDIEGFFYPVIDTSKCTNCKLCEKVCIFKNQ